MRPAAFATAIVVVAAQSGHGIRPNAGDIDRPRIPVEKVKRLFGHVTASSEQHPGQLLLLGCAGQPDVAAALERTTKRRIGYVSRLLRDTGLTPAVADLPSCSAGQRRMLRIAGEVPDPLDEPDAFGGRAGDWGHVQRRDS